MKIALISFGYNRKSGIENVVDNVIRSIDGVDKENEYIMYINKYVEGYYPGSSGVSKKIVPMAKNQMLKTLWLIFVYPLVSLIEKIDITVVFSGTNNFSLSPFTRNIVYIHDLGELYIKNKYDKKKMIYRKYLALPINKIMGDMFIAVSRATRNAIINNLGIAEDKIRLIYNGAGENIERQDKNAARRLVSAKYHLNDEQKIIIVVGRIDPVGKNLLRLIEAMSICAGERRDFHLFLIGESNFSNSHLAPEKIEELGLNEYITLTGYVGMDELGIFYNSADLLVFPSVHEGFGLPLLEAMKCEVPIACSDIDVFHEIGGDAAVYFDPDDAADIAQKISSLLSDEIIKSRLIKNGNNIQANFTWENSAKELLETFTDAGKGN